MSEYDKLLSNALQEMRRGVLVLAVLSKLDEPCYGYSLIQALSEHGLEIDQNTLYPLLRRLEKQGLLESIWQLEDNRPRRYYKISEEGLRLREALTIEWQTMANSLNHLFSKEG
ncbi:MAG: PadR family transcriptional regulator [Clostridiales bacterium 38-18]|nr:MAG: PadR family transcriptional regulator [Clostridiales bacterium 38-18]